MGVAQCNDNRLIGSITRPTRLDWGWIGIGIAVLIWISNWIWIWNVLHQIQSDFFVL